MMRALLLLTFTLVVLPGVLRCLPPPPPPPAPPAPARLVVSRRHIFGTAGASSSSGLTMWRPGTAGGPDEVHLGSHDPVRTLHVQPDFLVMLPLGTGASNFVSIFDRRLKQFLCMDLGGEVYRFSERNSEDCLFQLLWSDSKNRRHVLHSSSSGLLLRVLQTPEAHRALQGHEETPEGPHRDLLETPEGPQYRPRRGQEGHHLETPEGYRPLTQGGSHRGGTRGQSSSHGGTRGQSSPRGGVTTPHDHALLSALLARLVLLRRQPARRRPRRSDLLTRVNPSDPLRSEHEDPHHHHHHHHLLLLTPQEGGGAGTGGVGGVGDPGPPQPPPRPPPPEQEQPGAVSKETITSCDDPLRVLQQPSPPVSPVKTNLNMALHADEAWS